MTDHILYNFDANHDSLDEIHTHMQGINSARADVATVFNALHEVYEGDAADQLHSHHQAIQAKFDDHMNDRMATHTRASTQQDDMHALDRANAAQFG